MLLAGLLATAEAAGAPAGAPAESARAQIAAPAPQVARVRIPGTRLVLGDPPSGAAAAGRFLPVGSATAERRGDCRFFGLEAHARLAFVEDQLDHVTFALDSISSHSVDYVEDQLRRSGYQRRCETLERSKSDCVWSGAVVMELKREGVRLEARVRAREPAPEPPAAVRPAAPDTVVMLADTLSLARESPGRASPVLLDRGALDHPTYPPPARRAGVQGVVLALALVDTSGAVMEAQPLRGPRELEAAALDLVRGLRFQPYALEGRACRFRVVVPVVYTLY